MKYVVSASRRTDLVSFFPRWLSRVLENEKAVVVGPSGRTYEVCLNPEKVHTLVLWSKDFSNVLYNRENLCRMLNKYRQVYLHFTITGLGGTVCEPRVISPQRAIAQLGKLIEWVRDSRRVSIRFDPVVYWEEEGVLKSNLHFFEKLAPFLNQAGIMDVRFSFAQWYRKAMRRANKRGFFYIDPPGEQKRKDASWLAEISQSFGLHLYCCCQSFLEDIPGIQASSCIDGSLLQSLHPDKEPVSNKKDASQRRFCRCTESIDIGSYIQHCPHSCVYCYANPLE